MGGAALKHCGVLASDIRRLGLSVEVGTDQKLKRMLELANKLQARYALIVGDNEIATKSYALKSMESGEQIMLPAKSCLKRSAGSRANSIRVKMQRRLKPCWRRARIEQ